MRSRQSCHDHQLRQFSRRLSLILCLCISSLSQRLVPSIPVVRFQSARSAVLLVTSTGFTLLYLSHCTSLVLLCLNSNPKCCSSSTWFVEHTSHTLSSTFFISHRPLYVVEGVSATIKLRHQTSSQGFPASQVGSLPLAIAVASFVPHCCFVPTASLSHSAPSPSSTSSVRVFCNQLLPSPLPCPSYIILLRST